jgi:hypothetical protein
MFSGKEISAGLVLVGAFIAGLLSIPSQDGENGVRHLAAAQAGQELAGQELAGQEQEGQDVVDGAVSVNPNILSKEDPVPESRLRHVVLFQFKESSSPQDIEKVVNAFRKLPEQIPQIAEFEYGENNSPEGLDAGFTHCFLVTFGSEKDRDAYLPHPEHQRFVELLRPHLEKALVVDYWTKQ